MEPDQLCALGSGLCLPVSNWLTLWLGVAGIVAGPITAVFSFWLGQRAERRKATSRRTIAKSNITIAQNRLVELLAENQAMNPAGNPYLPQEQSKAACRALVEYAAVLDWAASHPEIFGYPDWASINTRREFVYSWEYMANPRGRSEVFLGQVSPRHLRDFAKNLNSLLAQE